MPIPAPAPAGTTFADLIDRVRYLLRSYTGQHEVTTHLTVDLGQTDTTATIANGNAISTGVVEIDDELIWVDSSSGGTVTIPPYGRGYMASAAEAHTAGTQVLTDPFFPRKHIAQALVDTQRAIYPTLWQPRVDTFTASPSVTTYDLTTDTDRVLSVSWELPGPSGFWEPVRRWRTELNSSTSSGNSISIFDGMSPGRSVRVVYAAPFTELSAMSDTIESCGHLSSHADLLVYGACWRLVGFLEVSRLNLNSVENQERAKFASTGAASALTRQIKAIFDQRLEAERSRLLQQTPISIRYTR